MNKFEISKGAQFVLTRLKEAGFSAYLVGGCVRDFVMGKTPHDFDITTSATPEEMLEIFKDVTTFKSGVSHGTVGVHIHGENVEATTFRFDGEYADHRHPESVNFSRELKDDLARRDFTMNALAYSNDSITDLFGGLDDIRSRVVRCVGRAESRFEEDALRILRAVRFSSVLDFDIEEETSKAIFKKKELLTFISRERIAEEFIKLLNGKRCARILNEYKEVINLLFKEANFDSSALEKSKGDAKIAIFFVKSDFYRENTMSLKLPRVLRDKLIFSIELYLNGLPKQRQELKELISEKGEDNVALAIEIHTAFHGEGEINSYFKELIDSNECVTLDTLAIKGKDLLALGMPPSPKISETLKELLASVLKGEVANDREKLIEKVKKRLV